MYNQSRGECGACGPVDDRLRARVSARLGGRVPDLRLLVCDAGIILRGCSHSYYVKQLAQQAVMEESGLPVLGNEIEVR